jgi:hypothetical protein
MALAKQSKPEKRSRGSNVVARTELQIWRTYKIYITYIYIYICIYVYIQNGDFQKKKKEKRGKYTTSLLFVAARGPPCDGDAMIKPKKNSIGTATSNSYKNVPAPAPNPKRLSKNNQRPTRSPPVFCRPRRPWSVTARRMPAPCPCLLDDFRLAFRTCGSFFLFSFFLVPPLHCFHFPAAGDF